MSFALAALNGNGAAGNANAAARLNSLIKTKNTFMRLMAAQLQHQNPLSPMKSNQLGQQLAAFASVEEQTKTNALLTELVKMMAKAQQNPAQAYVGRVVTMKTDETPLSANGQAAWKFMAPDNIKKAVLQVYDAKGKLVKTETLSPPKRGENIFVWKGPKDSNGKPLPGLYKLKVTLTNNAGSDSKPNQIYTVGKIDAVEIGQGGSLKLKINGRLVDLTQLATKLS